MTVCSNPAVNTDAGYLRSLARAHMDIEDFGKPVATGRFGRVLVGLIFILFAAIAGLIAILPNRLTVRPGRLTLTLRRSW